MIPNPLTIPPWIFAETSYVYAASMAALAEMDHIRWEIVEDGKPGSFVGGPEVIDAWWNNDDIAETDDTLEFVVDFRLRRPA